jgi:hypothetical protein
VTIGRVESLVLVRSSRRVCNGFPLSGSGVFLALTIVFVASFV